VNVGGEDWAARATTVIPAGTHVRVHSADGIVLEVIPL
jgi:membrane protein implicated in regulation of membrane protease activity